MLLPRRRIQYTDNIHVFDINIVYYRTPALYNVIDSITIKDYSGVITNNFDIFMDSPDFYPMWYDDGVGGNVETLAEFNMTNENDNVFYWKNGRVKNFSADDYNNIDMSELTTRGLDVYNLIASEMQLIPNE